MRNKDWAKTENLMFTFTELLNQWFADHSDGKKTLYDEKKDNYFQFKQNVEQVQEFHIILLWIN